jgi:hypothetical protein
MMTMLSFIDDDASSSFDEDGVRDYEYHWRVSLWDSSTERMSGDAFIDVAVRSSPAADYVYLLELTNATIVPSQRYYLYVDLIPRYSKEDTAWLHYIKEDSALTNAM